MASTVTRRKERISLSHCISRLTTLDQKEAMISPSAVTSDRLYEQVSLYCKGQAEALVQEINHGAEIELKYRVLLHVI